MTGVTDDDHRLLPAPMFADARRRGNCISAAGDNTTLEQLCAQRYSDRPHCVAEGISTADVGFHGGKYEVSEMSDVGTRN